MKKLFRNLLIAILLFPINAFALGNISASPTFLSIEEGSSKTFTIAAYNTIGDVTISSSNSGVASVSLGEWGTGMVDENQTKTGTITVIGNSIGTAVITLSIDAATFDGEDLAGQTQTINVSVVGKTTPVPPSDNTPNNNPPLNNNNNRPSNIVPTKSTNNRIKELSIAGFELVKVDDHNYTLSVGKSIDSVNVTAVAEDNKAVITGSGEHSLETGENSIEIVVTSEAGSANKINIKITKREYNSIQDLTYLLNGTKEEDIEITIDTDAILKIEDIENIKNSQKRIKLNYYDQNSKLLYCWTLNGSKMVLSRVVCKFLKFFVKNCKIVKDQVGRSKWNFLFCGVIHR